MPDLKRRAHSLIDVSSRLGRWLLTSHWLIPVILLPPIAFGLTLTSALMSFVLISLIFRPSSKPATSRRTIAPNLNQQTTGLDGKKMDNDPSGRRTVSFVESETTEASDGGLVLKASETDGNSSLARTSQLSHERTESEDIDGLPLPSTPMKRTSGQAGGKIVQKSPAPSMMIQRRRDTSTSSAEEDQAGLRESLGDTGGESFEESVTASDTETGTDRD
jgi:hypothetical protein